MLCMLLYLYGEWKLTGTSDAEEEEEVSISLATPSAARLFLYSYVQRNMYKIHQMLKTKKIYIILFSYQ
ncbi:hypothetical protein T03_16149 [Trichinella britovi]|uniref:Uncharacterized protein n=1 Tax=Trichinella britovi TaxID=45882 RepID=A0A0V1D021_TRIBR|nr:hypothetical protein T03_16149 [Trichinella britovi]